MEISEYFRILRRWWPVVLVATILGVGLGYATMFSLVNSWLPGMFSTDYRSSATLFVATQNGTTASEAYQNNQFSMDRVVSYAGLATSEQVATRAVDELKAPISAGDLRGRISAQPVPKTVLLSVGVRDSDPATAQTYANAVSDQLVGLVGELETSRKGGTPAAGAVVVDEANYPTEIMGWALWKRLLIGGAVGLVLGVVIAVIIGVVDKRLRGRDSVEEVTDSPLLGDLPNDPARARVPVVQLDEEGLYAERVRALRASLRFTVPPEGSGPPHVIAITSPSPGEGRTTVAIDLAAALAEAGRSVVMVDGDLRHPALADRLPLNDAMAAGAADRGLSTVLAGEHNLLESLIDGVPVGDHTVTLLPSGPKPPRPGELWATDRATALFEQLGGDYDYVIVDTPPLNEYTDGAIASAMSDGAVVLARIRHTTQSALRRALQALQLAHADLIGTVVTFEPVGPLRNRAYRKQVTRDAQPDSRVVNEPDDAPNGGNGTGDTEAILSGGLRKDSLVGADSPRPRRARHGSG